MKSHLWLIAAAIAAFSIPAFASDSVSHWNGGRTVPVHKLAPRDAEGDKVVLAASLPRAISQEKTCGQCHDVASMHRGSHFRTGLDIHDAEPSVQVEPWFLADDKTGTAIPLSLHNQCGAYSPADLNISCWQWTKLFGRHFPGGGIASDTNAMSEVACERQRWFVTGPLGVNCLACHQQSGYDSSEWARQVLRENWQAAATAASGFAIVGGMNERLDSTWTAADNPDDHLFRVPEKTEYDLNKFDAKGRCTFDVGKPKSDNCLACHGVSEKGMPSHAIEGDVHLKRGMTCVDCHKNAMDHRIATTSCAKCHTEKGGMGPKPVHAGIPLVHFEKLSCTVCHSGVTAEGKRTLVRTPRANRIGVYGRAQWATDAPYILEPVFVKNDKGVIEPCRMMWPSGFYRAQEDGSLKPVLPAQSVAFMDPADADAPITQEMVKKALAKAGKGARYLSAGIVLSLDDNGELVKTAGIKEAQGVSWPVGHDVRAARCARGAAPVKCADCHTGDSEFFLGMIKPVGPVTDLDAPEIPQAEFLKVGNVYHAVLGTTFAMRPLFKVVLWTIFGCLCLFVAAAAAVALNRLGKILSDCGDDFVFALCRWVVDMGFVCCTAYLALSGVLGWLLGGMTGWWLVLHMVAGGGCAGSAILIAIMRAWERTERCVVLSVVWAFWVVFAAGTVFTAVMPMMTVFGSHGQEILLWSHRCVSLCFAAASAAVCYLTCFCKKR